MPHLHALSRQGARGRGTAEAPPNRFEDQGIEWDPEYQARGTVDPDPAAEPPVLKTTRFRDDTQSLLSRNQSPDIGFDYSLNPYRGCEHGCAYCYARPYHEYLGFNAGIDFESKIVVKERAASLLERELSRPGWVPTTLACSGVTDCYQPLEKRLEITRGCLAVLARCRHPVGIITKNHLVTRDLDHLQPLAAVNACVVSLSITTLDPKLGQRMEPRASSPSARLQAVRTLREAGIPVSVNVAPVIPGLNDHEIPQLLEAAADHGAQAAHYTVVRLPYGVKDLFTHWLDDQLPEQKEKILGRIRSLRGGNRLNDSRFGTRMSGSGPVAEFIHQLFQVSLKRHHLASSVPPLSTEAFVPPGGRQLELF